MIVAILYRLEGQPQVTGNSPFTDVAPGKWYTDAVIWAAENGIVSGYGKGRFGPGDSVTREQLAALLWRYAGHRGVSVEAPGDLPLHFPDAPQVSGWAQEAVTWMVHHGILNGKDGRLVPKGNASRAETATLLTGCLGLLEEEPAQAP